MGCGEGWWANETDPAVTKVQTDPAPANRRAIRCHERAGFERVGLVNTPDGPAVSMVWGRQGQCI
jgi:RimJ/RimL family protein N-acetyltransferase